MISFVTVPPKIEELLKQVEIREIPRDTPCTVSVETPISEVYRLLDEERPGAVLVFDGEELVGIFTDRDILRRTALESVDPATPIRQLMTAGPVTLDAGDPLADAIAAMTRRKHRNIPLAGSLRSQAAMVSSRDVLRFIAGHFPEAVLNLPPRLNQRLTRPEGG